MMPEADIVAFRGSVSNHWSRKSTADIVISWTWLYRSVLESPRKRLPEEEEVLQAVERELRRVGRRHAQDRLDEAAHVGHGLAVLVVGLGVDLRVAGDLAAGLGVVVDAPEVVAVEHRREGAVEREDLEAVARQVEVPDDLGPQERDDVGADRELEAGEDLLGHRRAAEDVAPLEDEDLLAGAREVGGVDQAVVAASDDDDVVLRAHLRACPPSISNRVVTRGSRGSCLPRAREHTYNRAPRQAPDDRAFCGHPKRDEADELDEGVQCRSEPPYTRERSRSARA